MVHGPAETTRAEAAAAALFTEDVAGLDLPTLEAALSDAPSTTLGTADLDGGLSLVDALVRAQLSASRGAARRDIQGGGIYVNGRKAGQDRPLGRDDLLHGRFVVLRRGKGTQHVLAVSPVPSRG